MSLNRILVLDGETAFKLHDTYGFPLDLTADVCRERDVKVDDAMAFEKAMDRQREMARGAGKFKMATALEYSGTPTKFLGYETIEIEDARIACVVSRWFAGARNYMSASPA